MLKKDLEQELNRTKLILDYAREELKLKDNIIKEAKEYINEDKNCVPKHIKEYFKDLLDKVGEE